ncbi:N-acetyltransferase 8F1-like isoform X2 [Arctopsyche grandis]
MKVSELSCTEPMICWIAEAYEPYFMTTDPCDIKYKMFNASEDIKDITDAKLRKKVIGVVFVRDYFGPMNNLWMYGLAVDSKYHRKGIAKILVRNACEFTQRRGYDSLELVITDLQNEARLMFLELGFKLKHIYHKKFFGVIPLGKYQMATSTTKSTD